MSSDRTFDRIVIIGTSGSGKSTLAGRIAERTNRPRIELDELFWGPNWTQTPDEVFFERIEIATKPDRWVLAGNYTRARDIIWQRATSVIWLDFSFPRTFWRVLRRTMHRCWTGVPILNGNRESFFKAFCDRDSILLWCITSYRRNRRVYKEVVESNRYPRIKFFPIHKNRQLEALVKQIVG